MFFPILYIFPLNQAFAKFRRVICLVHKDIDDLGRRISCIGNARQRVVTNILFEQMLMHFANNFARRILHFQCNIDATRAF